jgi:hypothetical protein
MLYITNRDYLKNYCQQSLKKTRQIITKKWYYGGQKFLNDQILAYQKSQWKLPFTVIMTFINEVEKLTV